MKCNIHNDRESVNVCGLCGKQFCGECLVNLNDRFYCKECLAAKVGPAGGLEQPEQAVSRPAGPGEKKSRFWAFVFSVVPGVGYLYLGLMKRGLQTMVVFFGSIFVASYVGLQEIMALVVPVIMFYSIFDTQQAVKTMNAGIPVEDKQIFETQKIPFTHNWIGYGLIVIGGFALMQSVLPRYFPFWLTFKSFLPPILIISLGVAILYHNTKKVQ